MLDQISACAATGTRTRPLAESDVNFGRPSIEVTRRVRPGPAVHRRSTSARRSVPDLSALTVSVDPIENRGEDDVDAELRSRYVPGSAP